MHLLVTMVLLLAAPPEDYKDAPFQGWAMSEERGSTRLIYFSKTSDKPWNYSPGQVAIEYGQPPWKQEYAQQFDRLTRGKRWRMGQNYWSNLDTRFPLRMGQTTVQPGIYYAVLERSAEDDWALILLDPDSTYEMKIDAWHVNRKESPEGLRVPLQWSKEERVADKLQIDFTLDEADHRKAVLNIRFGPHRLWVPVQALFQGTQVSPEE
ncbi:MAG TPA: DUF2911 domain-containing protein [Acidobacteriota bacterium]|nr:DUF2911 domain-containing protein [Acidobacteriota bacterium]